MQSVSTWSIFFQKYICFDILWNLIFCAKTCSFLLNTLFCGQNVYFDICRRLDLINFTVSAFLPPIDLTCCFTTKSDSWPVCEKLPSKFTRTIFEHSVKIVISFEERKENNQEWSFFVVVKLHFYQVVFCKNQPLYYPRYWRFFLSCHKELLWPQADLSLAEAVRKNLCRRDLLCWMDLDLVSNLSIKSAVASQFKSNYQERTGTPAQFTESH